MEWHLRHVFAKLGIRSRRQLEGVLEASDSEVPAARVGRVWGVARETTEGSCGRDRKGGASRCRSIMSTVDSILRGVAASAVGTLAMDALLYRRYRHGGGSAAFPAWESSEGL